MAIGSSSLVLRPLKCASSSSARSWRPYLWPTARHSQIQSQAMTRMWSSMTHRSSRLSLWPPTSPAKERTSAPCSMSSWDVDRHVAPASATAAVCYQSLLALRENRRPTTNKCILPSPRHLLPTVRPVLLVRLLPRAGDDVLPEWPLRRGKDVLRLQPLPSGRHRVLRRRVVL